MYAAQKYQIAGIISQCENYLQDNLATDNACTLFSTAKLFTMAKLKTNALKFIADNAAEVFKNDDFLKLLSEDLVDILELDSLCVQEVDVIRTVLKWVDSKLTKSNNRIDGKSRRAVLLKDDILFTMAIPLLSLEEFTSVIIPSCILTDEEQLQIFKSISIPNNASSCGKFRVSLRKGGRVEEVFVKDILYPSKKKSVNVWATFSKNWTNLQAVTLSVKANKRIKIKSITLNPQFLQSNPRNLYFKIDIAKMQDSLPRTPCLEDCSEDDRNVIETEEGTLNVKYEGRACKIPIDKVIQQNEILELTINPILSNPNLNKWEPDQHKIWLLPFAFAIYNGMMYRHEISQQTTLYFSLRGGHVVESFEVMEVC